MESYVYAELKPKASGSWLAASAGCGAPSTLAFAAVQGAMEAHSTTRNDGIVRPMGPFGGSTG